MLQTEVEACPNAVGQVDPCPLFSLQIMNGVGKGI